MREYVSDLRSASRKMAARLHGRATLPAEWAIFRLKSLDAQFQQRLRFDVELNFSTAAVDQRPGGNHPAPGLLHDSDGLAGRSTRRPHVLYNQNVHIRPKRKPAPECHHPASVALYKHGRHSASKSVFR